MRRRQALATISLLALLTGVVACGSDTDESSPSTTTPTGSGEGAAEITAEDKEAVAVAYADQVFADYEATVAGAVAVQAAVASFVAAPSEDGLEAARTEWLTARDAYGPTEAFRFYDGPIDNPEDGPEGQINAWPMDEAYVDYTTDDPQAGIINNPTDYPEITADVLVEANEEGGETNISTGWHAIEFLLWGQDTSDTGPGARQFTDYTTAANADRRAAYLTELTDLLVADLQSVRDAWDPAVTDGYRAEFIADPDQALTAMLRGMGALSAGELAGERIAVAYETKDREDEHSCFSDNTNADVLNNAAGVQQVYLGGAEEPTATSLSALVAKVNPELDSALQEQLANSVSLAESADEPFEQLIQGADDAPGRVLLSDLIDSLQLQGDSVAEVAALFGYEVSLEI